VLALLLVPFALAGRVERVTELQTAGEHAEVVETVGKWEKGGSLGDEAAALVALRDRSALNLALAARTVEALRRYRQDWPQSTLLEEALRAEWEAAFAAAQEEGTAAAMKAYVTTYPNSTFRAQALAVEVGLAFQEASAVGTPAAIAAFTEAHPDSPYAATAWESLAARTPGIHVRLSDGLPQALEGVPVADGFVQFPSRLVMAPARPVVAVNLPGTGRGGTSEWWTLVALGPDGKVGVEPPVERRLKEVVGASIPELLTLEPLPGVHSARVAAPSWPLVAPGVCEGFARFAYVLVAEGKQTAFPFAVTCPDPAGAPAAGAPAVNSAVAELLTAVSLAEAGDPFGAAERWEGVAKQPDSARLLAWMETVTPDPRTTLLTRRPAVGDVLVWDGTTTAWWHRAEGGPVELARREGLWVADSAHLWSWAPRVEPWAAPAVGRCKAATGERQAATLIDTLGTERVDVPFTVTPRGGSLTPKRVGVGGIELEEAPEEGGCGPAAPITPRTIPLPIVGAGASAEAATAPPPWARVTIAEAPGASVVSRTPRALFAAFTAPVAPVAPAEAAPLEAVLPQPASPDAAPPQPAPPDAAAAPSPPADGAPP
jgi:hypothetical protein